MKKKGFTLIELVVVVAIILLLAATLAPKLRKEVAKARDAKAVAALGSVRTAINVFLADTGEGPDKLYSSASGDYIIYESSSSDYLENNAVTYMTEETPDTEGDIIVPIGGSQPFGEGDVVFGGTGEIRLNSSTVEVSIASVTPGGTGATAASNLLDTKGNEWSKY